MPIKVNTTKPRDEMCLYSAKQNRPLLARMVENLPAILETGVQSLDWASLLKEGMATPLHYSCQESSMDKGSWQATVHWVAKRYSFRANN